MADKKAYDRAVGKEEKSIKSLDKFYGGKTKEPKKIATSLVDKKIETKVRGYVSGSVGDPTRKKKKK